MTEDMIYQADQVQLPQPRMRRQDRAAQFAAFAALSGFDGVIAETGRLTENPVELDEAQKSLINERLCEILAELDRQPAMSLVWYCPDSKKTGGALLPYKGNLKKLDADHRLLHFTDGAMIPIDAIVEIK